MREWEYFPTFHFVAEFERADGLAKLKAEHMRNEFLELRFDIRETLKNGRRLTI